MAGPSSPNGAATTSFDAQDVIGHAQALAAPRGSAPRDIREPSLLAHAKRAACTTSQLSATAPKRAEAVSGIVSKTVRRLTGERRFESLSLQRGVRCEPDFLDQGCASAPL